MMFQSYALFPHMTVEQNVAFGLKQENISRAEVGRRVENCPTFFNRQTAAVIRERVNDHHRVFASFDHFVEVTDRAIADGRSQWAVVPDGFFTFQKKASHQVCCGEVFMTGDGD